MKVLNSLPLLALLAPLAAAAQVEYSQARIQGEPVSREELRTCLDRVDSLTDRKSYLDREKMNVDLDGEAIAAEGARLGDELRRLDNNDAAAVAAYNSRSADQNRRVDAHNRRVFDMNSAASRFNGDSVDVTAYCNWRTNRLR